MYVVYVDLAKTLPNSDNHYTCMFIVKPSVDNINKAVVIDYLCLKKRKNKMFLFLCDLIGMRDAFLGGLGNEMKARRNRNQIYPVLFCETVVTNNSCCFTLTILINHMRKGIYKAALSKLLAVSD